MNQPGDNTCIIICGPTASGKTAAAIHLARKYNTEIISVDSRQCFRELKIGVARPSEKELNEVKHHFIATHSIFDNVNAATFESYALSVAEHLFQKHRVIVMAGGTGLYIKAFCEGLDAIPEIDPEIRDRIIAAYEEYGLLWLQDEVRQKDPDFFEIGEIHNPQRMMRALEVKESTGQSIISFRKNKKIKRNFNIVKIGMELEKEILHQHIHKRVDAMIENGLVNEVKSLVKYRELNALQTVGYNEIFKYLDGQYELQEAIEEIKKNTRQYAKRQMTWFKKDNEINWLKPNEIINYTL